MPAPAEFVFATCQVGAENALKWEVASKYPDWRVAFSRPGLLTFKLPTEHPLELDFAMRCVFARAHGFSLDSISGATPDELAAGFLGVVPAVVPASVNELSHGAILLLQPM